MTTERFNALSKELEVLVSFGNNNNTATVKKVANLTALIDKVKSWTAEKIVNTVLAWYRPIFNAVPKDVRGACKKAFCDAIRKVCADNGTMFLLDDNGNVIPKRALAKVRKSNNRELFQLLSNLLIGYEVPNTVPTVPMVPIQADELDPATAEAVEWMLEAA